MEGHGDGATNDANNDIERKKWQSTNKRRPGKVEGNGDGDDDDDGNNIADDSK